EWEHAPMIGTPFSSEAARYARRLATVESRLPDKEKALSQLLARWETGMVSDRRERRMAARLAAERVALPLPDPSSPAKAIAGLPSLAAITGPEGHEDNEEEMVAPEPVPPDPGDEDDDEEIFDAPEGDDFYDDAF